MFIIVSIYSKNLSSLTNFLKFFYRLKKNKTLKLKFYTIQSQKNQKLSFFSTLQSPHVNKKSQEQFEYRIHSKKLKIHVSQIAKFLATWKIVKTTLFLDIKMETKFWFHNKPSNSILLSKTNYDKFRLKFIEKRLAYFKHKNWSNIVAHTSLKLLDIRGEILLKSFF